MSQEKRLVLFFILAIASTVGMRLALQRTGLVPAPRPAAQVKAAPDDAGAAPDDAGKAAAQPPAGGEAEGEGRAEEPAPAAKPAEGPEQVAVAPAGELVLGSVEDSSPGGYRLEVRLDQLGAGVAGIRSSRWEAEREGAKPRSRPLSFLEPNEGVAPSFFLHAYEPRDGEGGPASGPDLAHLETSLWDVVRDAEGRAVRPATRDAGGGRAATTGQEVVFRSRLAGDSPVAVTKRYRLWPGEDGLELELGFEQDGAAARRLAYRLLGPHGVPIEGKWYTSTFRDVFFGGVSGAETKILTLAAYSVVKNRENPERYTRLPLKFAGVENQYFAVFVEPVPIPESAEQSRIEEARPTVIEADPQDTSKADVSVELLAKPFELPPDRPVRHAYRIYAGPKTADALAPYGATELSAYRKGWSLPLVGDLGASFMAQRVISPLLTVTYAATERVGRAFGGTRGNWGIAIILLTIVVRLILFPLGRKQARTAKKMQDLQPLLLKLKEECGDDKEKLAKEQFRLYKEYGVNPMGGCLPALVQLPVLIGLWQALNNSVALRHSSFLWIENLAAPDKLFKFPFTIAAPPIPIIGSLISSIGWALGPYFNLLPIVVVGLMLVQTKLFSPPPTTPEAEQQQAMMKYMMLFMAFMFYKVPSGLGIYFITSSLWQIGERLLLPKGEPLKPVAGPDGGAKGDRKDRPGGDRPGGNGAPKRPGGPQPQAAKGGWFQQVKDHARERFVQILADAEKERSARREDDRRKGDEPPPRERDRPRPKPGRRR